jgi:hypothetical protein
MSKLIKLAETAQSGNEVLKIAIYGQRRAVYTLQPC